MDKSLHITSQQPFVVCAIIDLYHADEETEAAHHFLKVIQLVGSRATLPPPQ